MEETEDGVGLQSRKASQKWDFCVLGTSGIPCPVPRDPQSGCSGFFGCLVTFLYCSKCLRCVFLWIFFFFFWNPNPKVVLPTVVISVLICTCDFRVVCSGTSGLFLTLEGNQFWEPLD